jgi:hypothetical protein
MALGVLAKVKDVGKTPSAPTYADLITVVGDAAYGAGGSAGFLAAFQTLVGQARTIVGVQGCSDPATVSELEYDFTNDKLFARVRTTGVESAVANQSAVTYRLLVLSK